MEPSVSNSKHDATYYFGNTYPVPVPDPLPAKPPRPDVMDGRVWAEMSFHWPMWVASVHQGVFVTRSAHWTKWGARRWARRYMAECRSGYDRTRRERVE